MNVSTRHSWIRAAALAAVCLLPVLGFAAPPVAGPNVNMVSGTKFPEGDPFLTKQNEPSIAVSSRNPRHLLAASNDYRQVAVLTAEGLRGGKAWNTLYKSVDGGSSWRSVVLGGCPINIPACNDPTGLTAPLKALGPDFSADPTVRPGPYGTFFYSFIAGRRDGSADGVVAVQRFVDKNNDIQRSTDLRSCAAGSPGCVAVTIPDGCTPGPGCTVKNVLLKPAEDPIVPDALSIVNVGTSGKFIDKPWNAADVPRSWNAGKSCDLLAWTRNKPGVVTDASENVPAFNVYVSFANFVGQDPLNEHPQVLVAVSTDCGKTFAKPIKISNPLKANSGTNIAIDPLTGTVYVVWRNFDGPGAIYMSKSTDGGKTWSKNPILVANFIAYDQGTSGASFRTLAFPSIAVSVKNNQSRVHVVWTQRGAPAAVSPPYACQGPNAASCDTRVVMSTSTDGGNTWPPPIAVNPPAADLNNPAHPANPANPAGRGHQFQPAVTFAAGKLAVTWLDTRLDHTEGVLRCPVGATCTSVNDLREVREPKGNLAPGCSVDLSKPEYQTPAFLALPQATRDALATCRGPGMANASDAVWTTYITDATPGLVRRHTLDTYVAMADPALLDFSSTRVSQYVFGSTVAGTVNPDGTLEPARGTYDIRQKEANPPNLQLFVNGGAAFIGDYIDIAGQLIVATGDPVRPYKYNVGGGANGNFTTSGLAPLFHVSFTDNRDVIPPLSGDWTTPTCLAAGLVEDGAGKVTGADNFKGCATPGYAGNRNQNVYSAIVAENSFAFANANSKLLNSSTPRGFVVTVQNVSDQEHTYTLTLPAQSAGVTAAFNKERFDPVPALPKTTLTVVVQPRSSSTRSVWATSTVPKANILVNVDSAGAGLATQLMLNADPGGVFVTNGDPVTIPPAADAINDDLGNVVLSNAVLTNNALSNNALTNNVLTNNALTNAVLSNVVLSNAVLSNLQLQNLSPGNAALTNNVLTNNVLSNVVLTNAVLSNAALSNAVLSNVVLSNSALNVALTNVDPANVALSNAVLSNNALTNVVLTNDPVANALSNAMLSNAVLSNAALSNVVLSNAALSNAALSNNALSNVALTNAPLSDPSNGTNPDADPLRAIEPASIEVANNEFTTGDLSNSNFRETSFTIRNHGNTDATLAVKLMLRDAVCTETFPGGITDGSGRYTCTTPGYKLQLVLRKVSFTPSAIAPTGPATDTGHAYRVGLVQRNTEVSNVGDLPIISPDDPTLGRFLPDDPRAATLPLAAGEWAYATIRAIGVGGATPPDPAELLRWGVKAVAANASNAGDSLIIRTLGFPASPAFIALDTPNPAFRTIGGAPPITGTATCSDREGNPILQGAGAPSGALGAIGNFYIDTSAREMYGPKLNTGWGSPTPQVGVAGLGDPQSGPKATLACPPAGIVVNPFTGPDPNATTLSFTPRFWGEFFMLASVSDSTGPSPKDRSVLRAFVQPRPPVFAFPGFPTTLVYNNNGAGIDLRPYVTSDSINSAGVAQPILLSTTAGGSCHLAPDGYSLLIDRATIPPGGTADCIVNVSQAGNETYAPSTAQKAIYIDQASQQIAFSTLPANGQLTYGDSPTTVVAAVSSPTAPPSGLSVMYTSVTPSICTTSGTSGVVTIGAAGTCQLQADQGGDPNYKPAPTLLPPSFLIKKAPTITVVAVANATYDGNPHGGVASVTGPAGLNQPLTVSYSGTGATTYGPSATAPTNAGTYSASATYAETANYLGSSDTKPFTINKAPTTTAVAVVDATYDGNPHGGTASVTGPAGLNQPLTVSYSGTGATTYGPSTTAPSNAGTYNASATYAETANYFGSSDTKPFTINKAPTTTAVAVVDATYDGNPHGGTASVTGPAGLNQPLTVSYTGTGTTTYGPSTTAPTDVGTYNASATYAETANYFGSSDTKPFTINKAPTTTAVAVVDATYDGNPHGGTASVTGPAGLNQPLTVSYSGTGATTYGPSATAPTNAGTYNASATYAETANYLGSSDTKPFTINKAPTTTAVISSVNPTTFGQPVTFTATVTGPLPLSGTVHSRDDGQTIVGCVASPLAVDQAQCVINTLGVGTHAITAEYSGDDNHLASTSPALTQTVIVTTGATTPVLAAGRTHTCALNSSGAAQCWGRNDLGQLGDTTTTERHAPVGVAGLGAGVDEVTAGAEHSCALTAAGGIKCWGDNVYGQVGDGTTVGSTSPVDVSGLTSGIVLISGGFWHTCAVTDTGGVKCWGRNQYGQLGDGTQTDRSLPVNVVGLGSGVVGLASSQTHTCALTATGGVKCWGFNSTGQLGNSTQTDSLVPVDVVGLGSGVAALAANGGFSCALTEEGAVKCWGFNGVGMLGDGTTTNRLAPVDTAGLASGVSGLTAGGGHACALTIGGGVKCWGYNGTGQLGDGTTTNRLTPVDVSGMTSGVSLITGGGDHTCALVTTGEVKCWGYNVRGQLGDGTTTNQSTATPVPGLNLIQ